MPQQMTSRHDKAGNLWEVDAEGNAVRIITAAPSPARAGFVYTPPPKPETPAEARERVKFAAEYNTDGTKKADAEVTAPGDTTLTGEAYLATINPGLRGQVKAIADGRRAFPTGAALRNPAIATLVAAATQYDPTLDAANAATRVKTRSDFTSGLAARNITSMNTALGHLGTLSNAAAKLDNGSFPWANKVGNYIQTKRGDPRVKNFTLARDAVANELMKVFRGSGGGSLTEIEEWKNNIDAADSPKQLHAVITQGTELLHSRLEAMNDQYERGMGKSGEPISLLSPHAREIFNKITTSTGLGLDTAPPATRAADIPPELAPPATSRDGGGPAFDYSEMSSGGDSHGGNAAGPGAKYRLDLDPAAASAIDSLVRKGIPYRQAAKQFGKQFPGAPTLPPGSYNDSLEYNAGHPNYKGSYAFATKQVPLGMLEQYGNEWANSDGGALIGNYANSTMMGIPAALAGDQGTYFLENASQRHPGMALGGQIAGNVSGALGVGKLLKAGLSVAGLDAFAARNAGRVAASGDAIYGGATGAIQNPDQPFVGGAKGAAEMLAGNALGRYIVGPGAAAVASTRPVSGAIDWAARRVGGRFNPAARLPRPEREIMGAVTTRGAAQPEFDAVTGRLSDAADLNMPYGLADAHPKLRALAGSAGRHSPDVRALAETTYRPRMEGQAERATGMIDTHLAEVPEGGVGGLVETAVTRARAATKDLYDNAINGHPAPVDHALNEMMRTPAGAAAARKAYDTALNNGHSPAELSFSVGADGTPMIHANPNWRTLQYMKQGLDDLVEEARDPLTGKLNLKNRSIEALNNIRTKFTGRLHELNDDFKAADSTYAELVSQGTAAKRGYDAAATKVTPSQLAGVVQGMPAANLPNFRRGYASAMSDNVGQAKLVTDPYKAIYGSPYQMEKLPVVFPEGAPKFDLGRRLERDMSDTATETIGGSPTAGRLGADKSFENGGFGGMASDVAFAAATGVPTPGLIRQTFGAGKNMLNLGERAAKAKADAIGPLLIGQDPVAAGAILQDIMERHLARRSYMDASRMAGAAAGAPLLYGFANR